MKKFRPANLIPFIHCFESLKGATDLAIEYENCP
jgi:hypothetical protein